MSDRCFVGAVFDRLTLVEFLGTVARHRRWRALCECGVARDVEERNLLAGQRSCGCFRRERMANLNRTHGQASPGRRTVLYRTWQAMHERCGRNELYIRRRITVCDEWCCFEPFRDYMVANFGAGRPRGHTLDRIDNDRGYEPGNVRWATPRQQLRNASINTVLVVDGESHCIAEWAEIAHLTSVVICARLRRGWTVDRTIKTPRREYHRDVNL